MLPPRRGSLLGSARAAAVDEKNACWDSAFPPVFTEGAGAPSVCITLFN
ncbi:MAG: hypothetical protein ACOC7V_10395 [Spirochaetota bacterium]